jgi:hypothetical protein
MYLKNADGNGESGAQTPVQNLLLCCHIMNKYNVDTVPHITVVVLV